MNTINSKSKSLEEVFGQALELGKDLTIECSDGRYALVSGALLKIKDRIISCWNGESWDILNG